MPNPEYRERVSAVASSTSGGTVFNGTLDHAAVIVEHMFKTATAEVCILTEDLNSRAYGASSALEEARKFAQNGSHQLNIIMEAPENVLDVDHPYIDEFLDNPNVAFRCMPKEAAPEYSYHFLVADGCNYRYEQDKTLHSAVATWKDRKLGQVLRKRFFEHWENSVPVENLTDLRSIAKENVANSTEVRA